MIGPNPFSMASTKRTLKPAILSSFAVTDEQSRISEWPAAVKDLGKVEIYAFMQSDAERLLVGPLSRLARGACNRLLPRRNALCAMARLAGSAAAIHRVAKKLNRHYSGLEIIGFATYLPEIMGHAHNKEATRLATNALLFLVRVARTLQQEYGHGIQQIEIVGGSRVDGLWRGRSSTDSRLGNDDSDQLDTFIVNRLEPLIAIRRLLERLQPVAVEAAKDNRMRLALELEPGPLFTINSRESLEQVCEVLEEPKWRHTEIANVLGFNLDVPHWAFLSNATTEWVKSKPNDVFKRIIHAHICDHGQGHLADSPIRTFHKDKDFLPWLSLLKELTESSSDFSGYVSCEMESCIDEQSLIVCVKILRDLLK